MHWTALHSGISDLSMLTITSLPSLAISNNTLVTALSLWPLEDSDRSLNALNSDWLIAGSNYNNGFTALAIQTRVTVYEFECKSL